MSEAEVQPIRSPGARADKRRVRLALAGLVQGVGFRPYVSRLATDLGLAGWVANSEDGVRIEVEGSDPAIEVFLRRLPAELPPLARLDRLDGEDVAPAGERAFTIRESAGGRARTALILPDVATCPDCLAELFDPADRRHLYPFTNCTNCGPRFSILEALPYDRPNTTMRGFAMCASCQAEYDDPSDRRFHAQPNACPDCGPKLALVDAGGRAVARRHEALLAAAEAIRAGGIVALKGIGGFQLLVDARAEHAVTELRRRKRRPDKPFAVMAPSLADVENLCRLSEPEREALTSPAAPIVLMRRRARPADGERAVAPSVAPANPLLGVMLPCTPLHHLLMRELGFAIVATSGNLSNEPIAVDEGQARERLGGIADAFLTHDRPIACALDDSVVRVIAGRALVLRRARGYAPLSLALRRPAAPVLALGGHLKAAPAATVGDRVTLGPHVGDLEAASARTAFHAAVDRLRGLYGLGPAAVACDRHPDYYTTRIAPEFGAKTVAVGHHLAHIAACMADNGLDGPVLGVAWDGTGHGADGTVWGGEFMAVDGTEARRVAHLRPFPLPGGERAVTEPRRAAVGLLYELMGEAALADASFAPVRSFSPGERDVLKRMLARKLNAPRTSSVGRLFDAVAALTGLVQTASFEGQAAMALEYALGEKPAKRRYSLDIEPATGDGPMILDWRPMARNLLDDVGRGVPTSEISAAFHNALIDGIVAVARRVGEARIVLTGGCFQNRTLTERTVEALRGAGFEPYWHRHVPPNDGGLALGQAVWAARLLEEGAA